MSDTQEHKTDFLGRDAIFPLLIKLGVPAAVGMLVNALYNVVDTIYVGLGVGPLAIAALSIVFPIQMIVSALAQAIGMGSASIVSRRLGEKRPEEATKAIGSAYASVSTATAASLAALAAASPSAFSLAISSVSFTFSASSAVTASDLAARSAWVALPFWLDW